MNKILGLLLVAVLTMPAVFAGDQEHSLTDITGTNLDLKAFDHAFAGSVGNSVVWGFLDEASFTSELIVRKYQQTIKTTFKKADNRIGGVIQRVDGDRTISTEIYVKGVNAEQKQILLSINNEDVLVTMENRDFQDGHFIDTTFSATLNGMPVSFNYKGEACLGLAMHFAMMIFGAMAY